VDKVMSAPAVVIVAYDKKFYDMIPQLFPHNPDAKGWFEGNESLIEETAFRNGTLQGAYLMIAARALGLDCGPMSGFDRAGVDLGGRRIIKKASNFLCGLGYGDDESIFARSPRLDFSDACQLI
jgi:3-hydroxypropanoate dehydrogenase